MKKILVIAIASIFLAGSLFAGDTSNVVVSKTTAKDEKIRKLSVVELIDIFTRKKTLWDSGTKIVVVIKKQQSAEHLQFVYDKLGITPFNFRERLTRNVYKGKGSPPIEVSSDEEVVDIVLSTPGAIGYINNMFFFKSSGTLYIVDDN